MQNEIVSTQGGYNRPDRTARADPTKHAVIPRFREQVQSIQHLLQAARESGVLVVYAEYVHRDQNGKMIVNGPECYCHRHEDWVSCAVDGTWEAQVIQELAPQPGEITVKKCRGDAFYNTYLGRHPTGKGYYQLDSHGHRGRRLRSCHGLRRHGARILSGMGQRLRGRSEVRAAYRQGPVARISFE